MDEVIRTDLLNVLQTTVGLLSHPPINTSELKKISDRTIHNASIYQDEYSISCAILLYSLSKIFERMKDKLDYKKIKIMLEDAIDRLQENALDSYQNIIKQLFSFISSADEKFKIYIQEVIRQASIKKGSRIYEHGISASKTAQILGISVWDLYQYLGATRIADIDKDISSVRDRLEFTRELFS